MALTNKLAGLAYAIRAKSGKDEMLTLDQMIKEIYNFNLVGEDTRLIKNFFDLTKSAYYLFYKYDGTEIPSNVLAYSDTSAVTNMSYMFNSCSALTTIPQLDTSAVTNMSYMFNSCSALTTIPQLDTSAVTNMNYMFSYCSALTTIPQLDTSAVTNMNYMFQACKALTDCYLRNIKINLQVGSGSSYGHLLTLDSLLFMIGELINVGASRTFTVGSANLAKLADVYVKKIDITDEMRAEDPYVDQKLPFEVCESTDEGALLVADYMAEKKWTIA